MDKETLSNYGWIVICVLVMVVMIALAGPFGNFISEAVKSTTQGLFDTNQNALDAAGITIDDNTFVEDDGGSDAVIGVNHNGPTIPEGATYTKTDGTVLNAGDTFPEAITNGDKYTYEDYEYRYNQVYSGSSWTTVTSQNGWGVRASGTKDEYGQIIDSIANQPITSLNNTFFNMPVKTINTTIPSTVTDMNATFMFCPQLTAIPEIPKGVKNMRNTFAGSAKITSIPKIPSTVENMEYAFQNCKGLTGTIEINTNTTGFNMNTMKVAYDLCFSGVDFESQGITLTGKSTVLDSFGATDANYCAECNGCCKGNH